MSDPTQQEKINSLSEFAKLDYERTLDIIQGFVGVSNSVRTFTITVWSGLLAAAVGAQVWELAAIAAFVTVIFGLIDSYHARLYAEARARAWKLEKALDKVRKLIARGEDDPDAGTEALQELTGLSFGTLSQMKKQKATDRLGPRPLFFFRWFYPPLTIAATVIAVLVGISASEGGTGSAGFYAPHATKETSRTGNQGFGARKDGAEPSTERSKSLPTEAK